MDRRRRSRRSSRFVWLCRACSVVSVALVAACGDGNGNGPGFERTDLVSNVVGDAPVTDPNLTNPWGMAAAPGGPWWVSDNHSGFSTLYDGTGAPFPPPPNGPLVVTIPPPAGSPPGARGAPTGLVFNGTADFVVTQGAASGPALFIFSTENGTISGWNLNVNVTNAVLTVDHSAAGAIYKGLAIGVDDGDNRLYASNFHAGTVDVFDRNFAPVIRSGAFTDPNIPAGFAPFGIQQIGGNIYVTYAEQDADKEDDVPGQGKGYVDIFDPAGNFVRRFVSKGKLNAPWAVVQAPASFGRFSDAIIIGNFGNGRLNAYDPDSGDFEGQLNRPQGGAVQIEGLWGLAFGNGTLAGSTDALYFTAGPNEELDGVFGMLTATGN